MLRSRWRVRAAVAAGSAPAAHCSAIRRFVRRSSRAPAAGGVQQGVHEGRRQRGQVPGQYGLGLVVRHLVDLDADRAGRQQGGVARGDQPDTATAPCQEGGELLRFPRVVENEQGAGALVEEPAQVGAGQVRVVELGGVAGDEPGDLRDLGRHGRTSADVPSDGDVVDPGTEPPPHAPAGAHGGCECGLSEPSRSPQGGGDTHGAAAAAHGCRGGAGLGPVHEPVGNGHGRRERRIVPARRWTHLHPHQDSGRQEGQRSQHTDPRPRMSAKLIQHAGPTRGGCGGVPRQRE